MRRPRFLTRPSRRERDEWLPGALLNLVVYVVIFVLWLMVFSRGSFL